LFSGLLLADEKSDDSANTFPFLGFKNNCSSKIHFRELLRQTFFEKWQRRLRLATFSKQVCPKSSRK
jgi:hypothetical protein